MAMMLAPCVRNGVTGPLVAVVCVRCGAEVGLTREVAPRLAQKLDRAHVCVDFGDVERRAAARL